MDWQTEFRQYIAPQLPTKGLQALGRALEYDKPSVLRCETCRIPVDEDGFCIPAEGACPIAYTFLHDSVKWSHVMSEMFRSKPTGGLGGSLFVLAWDSGLITFDELLQQVQYVLADRLAADSGEVTTQGVAGAPCAAPA